MAKLLTSLTSMFKRFQVSTTDGTELKPEVLLSLQSLKMQFGGLVAVNNLSFDVKRGEIFGLIGPNGAGKTTVFNCITQFYKPTSGKIYYRGSNGVTHLLNTIPVHDIIRHGIVRTFQNVELVWELSVLDNLLVASTSQYRSGLLDQFIHSPRLSREEQAMREKASSILDKLGLTSYKHLSPYGLPYGIMKTIELARTLMCDPELIILDEPAAGLNDAETVALAHTIQSIRQNYKTTIFLVEHDMGLVMSTCDTVCAISFGKLLGIGTPSEIQKNPAVKEAYLGVD